MALDPNLPTNSPVSAVQFRCTGTSLNGADTVLTWGWVEAHDVPWLFCYWDSNEGPQLSLALLSRCCETTLPLKARPDDTFTPECFSCAAKTRQALETPPYYMVAPGWPCLEAVGVNLIGSHSQDPAYYALGLAWWDEWGTDPLDAVLHHADLQDWAATFVPSRDPYFRHQRISDALNLAQKDWIKYKESRDSC